MSAVPLNVHSRYSFLRGLPDVTALAQAARARGHDTLALTDTNGIYGLVFFLQAARAAGVRPLIGCEIDEGAHARAVLLAKDREGYASMCRQLTAHHAAGPHAPPAAAPRAPLGARLAADHTGLVILSDAPAVLRALPREADAWVELRSLAWNTDHRALRSLAHTLDRELVATHPTYALEAAEHAVHRLLRAIARNTTLSRVSPGDLVPEDCALLDDAEMARRFPHAPDALANTRIVAERCALAAPIEGLVAPLAHSPGDAAATLRAHAYAGAARRYGALRSDVVTRLEYELGVIVLKGFAEYFLVVEDIVRHAPRTCGRGSAAASIVSYALGITHVDPLAHDLFFERFLNAGRSDPPDIDVDFPWDERDAVLDYIFARYGTSRAAMVANHVGFRARAAVREVAKVYGLADAEIAQVTRRLSHFWDAEDPERTVTSHPLFADLRLHDPWPEILRLATALEGHVRHLSVHCGGVVIVPDAMSRYVPSEYTQKGVPVIQWEKDQTEDAGLVKIDILGNRSLAVVRDALAALRASGRAEIDPLTWHPTHDAATQQLIARGDTLGVFYVESPAMRQLLRKARTGDFEHLVVMSSLIRPAANTYIRQWLERLHGAPYVPLHPLLGEILSDTYGVMVYQEDVTKVAMALAGFDAVDGDGLRKALSKKRPVQLLRDYRARFVDGGRARGVDVETIDRIWDMILSFSGYSFCKPHSASYAMVSFQSAFLRAHHPAEFLAAVLSNGGGFYATFAYVSEAARMGLRVLPPDVNDSDIAYRGDGAAIRTGLQQIRGLSLAAQDAIAAERARGGRYASLDGLVRRTGIAPADAWTLVLSGACDALEPGRARPELLWDLRLHHRAPASLFGAEETRALRAPDVGAYDASTLLRLEVETLGFLLSRHPLTLYRDRIRALRAVPAREMAQHAGRSVRMIGWYVTSKTVTTKRDEPMEFVSFEDTTGLYETTFFPDAYRRFCRILSAARPYVLEGVVEEEFGAVTLTVTHAEFLDRAPVLARRASFTDASRPARVQSARRGASRRAAAPTRADRAS